MTVGSQVKGCFASIKSAEASLEILANKAQDNDTEQAYKEALNLIKEVKDDLDKQIIFLSREEPQYR